MVTFPTPKNPPRFKPNWQRPAKLIDYWPPLKADKKHKVMNGYDFWTIARNFHRANPWDIIIFNFQTEDAREINWYLHHAVGCYKSRDGSNFMFDDADPGYIYIPPKHWRPDPKFKKGSSAGTFIPGLIDNVHRMLARCSAIPTLYHDKMTITAVDIIDVAGMVKSGEVGIDIDTSLKDDDKAAEYNWLTQDLTLSKQPKTADYSQHGVLVHEAVHTALHKKETETQPYQEEVMAHFVQSVAMARAFPGWVDQKLRELDWLYYIGWVVANYYPGEPLIKLSDLNDEHVHPYNYVTTHWEEQRTWNPVKMLLEEGISSGYDALRPKPPATKKWRDKKK